MPTLKDINQYLVLLTLGMSAISLPACAALETTCSSNWQVTGYYTPIESDFQGTSTAIVLQGKTLNFPNSFLSAVKMEGWGKTRAGWYLGFYANRWHKSSQPLNRNGKPLAIGMAAVDPNVVAIGRRFSVPSLQTEWRDYTFVAADVGGLIKQKHIDIYTGEGQQAKATTYRLTGHHKICYQP